jgi:hypothetical protein
VSARSTDRTARARLAFVLPAVFSLVLPLPRRTTLRSALPFWPFPMPGAVTAALLS